MADYSIDDYFELALDLPERERVKMLARLDRDDPPVAGQLRALLTSLVSNPDFACQRAAPTQAGGLDRIEHVALQVDDLEAAGAWYLDNFGCEIARERPGRVDLRFENVTLALVLREEQPGHVALSGRDLKRFGSVQRDESGERVAYIVDPAGNPIHVRSRRS